MPVEELLDRIDAREMEEWVLYYRLMAEDEKQSELNRRAATNYKPKG